MRYSLINKMNSPSLLEQVFINRGIEKEDIKHYLETTDKDIIDPSIITNIKEGATMLVKHIKNKNLCHIVVDSDCDGMTSAAFLMNYLYRLFPAFTSNCIEYSMHDGKQHGINIDKINQGVRLVIAPDSSSDEQDIHQQLKERGIDVLVIDHHHASGYSKYACVINNQLDNYPTKSLSGVGMVYKFCSYIDSLMNTNHAEDLIDLAALGIIADAMDLKDFETRRIIDKGLNQIKNPYIKGMIDKNSFSFKDGVNPHSVAFNIAPAVNAIMRVGTHEEKIILFESMLEFKAYEKIDSTKRGAKGQLETIVEQSCRNSTNVRNRQNKSRDLLQEDIEKIIEEKNLLDNKILLIKMKKADETVKNITGLVANRLMAKYQRPVMLLSKREELWEGSIRNDGGTIESFMDFLLNSGLVEYVHGHQNAAGAGVKEENIEKLMAYANNKLKDFDFTPQYKVDAIYYANNTLPIADMKSVASLDNIWGQGIAKPLVAIKEIKADENTVKMMANNTLKITIPGTEISMIKFKVPEEEYEKLIDGFNYITVIGTCEINSWNNSLQIKVEDFEITKHFDYLF